MYGFDDMVGVVIVMRGEGVGAVLRSAALW